MRTIAGDPLGPTSSRTGLSASSASVLLAVFVGFTLSCDDPVSIESALVGEYELTKFEGVPVPGILMQSGDIIIEMLSGKLWIRKKGTCSGRWTVRVWVEGEPADSDAQWDCTWSHSGTEVFFAMGGESMGGGSLVGDQLLVTHETGAVCIRAPCPSEYTAVYRRVGGG